MVCKKLRGWTSGQSLPVLKFVKYHSPPPPAKKNNNKTKQKNQNIQKFGVLKLLHTS